MTQTVGMKANEVKGKAIARDFRTDTITMPTDAMFDLMKEASRGDDVYGEDDATNELQDRVAKLAGFEAALFCVSGTMTNQLAIRTHLTQPPHSVLLDARAHIHLYEAGGVAFHSQANSLAITPSNGHHLTLEEIETNIVRGDDIHSAPTRIVALENTLSGMVFPQAEIVRISDKMRKEGVIMHCDGARMWEVVAKTGLELEELCRPFDSISLCMSKGLGAPIGSILCGPKKFIGKVSRFYRRMLSSDQNHFPDHLEKAKWFRKLFGGGIRQCGGLASAASFALTHHLPMLPQTHLLAASLATRLSALGVKLLLPTETHMLWIDPAPLGFSIQTLVERAKEKGIRLGSQRLVVHIQVTREATDDLVELIKELKEEFKELAEPGLVDVEQNERFGKGDWQGMGNAKLNRMGTTYAK